MMMDRRRFLETSLAGALVAPLPVDAQQQGKTWRIGYLSMGSPDLDKAWMAAFRRGLRELGYIEGDNAVIEERHAGGRSDAVPELVAGLVRLRVSRPSSVVLKTPK
jgi:putative tryptophan/tyrosine transport system substrate-binding protein